MLDGLAEDEAGLRLRALTGVDDEEDAVHHLHDALDLASEISMPGGIDDVDGVVAPVDGGVLGLDGDAFLALEVHGVHGALGEFLMGLDGAAGLEEFVHEGGLAVVDVGDDGDVADLLGEVGHFGASGFRCFGWEPRSRQGRAGFCLKGGTLSIPNGGAL